MAKKKEAAGPVSGELLAYRKAQMTAMVDVINKGRTKEVIHFGLPEIKMIPTRSKYINQLMGGGVMRGRITTFMGEEGCLAGETLIRYTAKRPDGTMRTSKTTTMVNFYNRFHKIKGPSSRTHLNKEYSDSTYLVSAINDQGFVISNPVEGVIKTGEKECYELKTVSGKSIIATANHEFYNGEDYTRLDELDIGDMVYIHENKTIKKPYKEPNKYVTKTIKYHPTGFKRLVEEKYIYYIVHNSHIVYEARMNNLKYDDFIEILNTQTEDEINKMWFVPKGFEIHHKDENSQNDVFENLELLSQEDHARKHAIENHNNLRFQVNPDEIISIESVGIKETYDIQCIAPFHNFIANGIAVHNSCKTTTAAIMMADALQQDPESIWMWLDFENSLYEDRVEKKEGKKTTTEKTSWLQTLGVDTDRVIMVHSLQTMEEYCNILKNTLQQEKTLIGGVVIDSIGAMMPQGVAYTKKNNNLTSKGLETDTMALLARSLGKFLSTIKALLNKHDAPMLAITHVYADLNNGGYLIPKGGNAFRHYSDFRLRFGRGARSNWPWNEKINDKEVFLGFDLSITIDKTKNSKSKKERTQINLPFIYGKGIDETRFLVERAIYDKKIHQAGAYFYLEPDLSMDKAPQDRSVKIQGRKNFWEYVEATPAFQETICDFYKDIDLFQETPEEIKILNEDEDNDILDAANECAADPT